MSTRFFCFVRRATIPPPKEDMLVPHRSCFSPNGIGSPFDHSLLRHARIQPYPRRRSFPARSRGLWEEVQGFLETMREEDLTPDTVTFNTAIKAVADNGQCDVAFSLLAEMKNEGLTPDQVTLLVIFRGDRNVFPSCAFSLGALV